MIELIGCIMIILITIAFVIMIIDELRTNYELRKSGGGYLWHFV